MVGYLITVQDGPKPTYFVAALRDGGIVDVNGFKIRGDAQGRNFSLLQFGKAGSDQDPWKGQVEQVGIIGEGLEVQVEGQVPNPLGNGALGSGGDRKMLHDDVEGTVPKFGDDGGRLVWVKVRLQFLRADVDDLLHPLGRERTGGKNGIVEIE